MAAVARAKGYGQAKGSFKGGKGDKGVGKGFGKPAAEPGHRVQVTQRVTGTLTEWKGKMGWIKPNQQVSHPEASMHKGRIYCGQEDIEAEIDGPGATVSFMVYADGTGLGAMHVRPAAGGGHGVQKAWEKPAGKAAGKGASKGPPAAAKGGGKGKKGPKKLSVNQTAPDKSAREVVDGMPVAGIVKRVDRKVAFIMPDEPVEHELAAKRQGLVYLHMEDMEDEETPLTGAQVIFFVYVDEHGLGAERCTIVQQGDGEAQEDAKAEAGEEEEPEANGGARKKVMKNNLKEKKGKGKGKGEPREKGPSGPDLPRERITTEPVVGEMLAWKKKWGWIMPAEPIDHPAAEKHEGKIYIHEKDIEGEPDMATSKQFAFHVFVDQSGLGAEECVAC